MKNKGVVLLIVFIAGLLAVVAMLSKSHEVPVKKAAVGLSAPAFQLTDTEGRTWDLSSLKGKVVLLNFWASWCDSCKEENPSLQALVNSEKGNERFVFASVLYKDEPSTAIEYMKKNGIDFPLLIDNKNISSAYGLTGVPETFIIDKKGIVREKIIGPIKWDTPEIRAAIDKLISEN